jgi:FKBP-type peptidyl-prolyl cis-trans isomerase
VDNRVKGLIAFGGVLAVVVLVVLLAGGDDDDSGSDSASAKPAVEIPEGDPPTELVVDDLEEGDGAEAQIGDQLSVQYVGVLFDGGAEFDSNFDTGQPFEFALGGGQVIPGWDEGLVGMKEGGRRQLTIPPDLAYGAQGQPPDIPPDSTLVFVIDLESVTPAAAGGAGAAP